MKGVTSSAGVGPRPPAISLLVVGTALRYHASAAFAKGATLWVIGVVIWHVVHGTLPSAFATGAVGAVALAANVASFRLLLAHRKGAANMHSARICTRNDMPADMIAGRTPENDTMRTAENSVGLGLREKTSNPSLLQITDALRPAT